MKQIEEMVQDFNKSVIGIDRGCAPIADYEEKDWLTGVLREEIDEFDLAYAHKDFVGQIDAIIDLMYFALGGMTRMGIDHKVTHEIFTVVHEANLKKQLGKKAQRENTHELDAVKPENWRSPEEQIVEILEFHYGKG